MTPGRKVRRETAAVALASRAPRTVRLRGRARLSPTAADVRSAPRCPAASLARGIAPFRVTTVRKEFGYVGGTCGATPGRVRVTSSAANRFGQAGARLDAGPLVLGIGLGLHLQRAPLSGDRSAAKNCLDGGRGARVPQNGFRPAKARPARCAAFSTIPLSNGPTGRFSEQLLRAAAARDHRGITA